MDTTLKQVKIVKGYYFKILLWLLFYTALALFVVVLASNKIISSKDAFSSKALFLPTVVIDPGHGGFDGGAVSPSGLLEKDVNLDISLRLYSLFSLSDIPCILTRSTDTELSSSKIGSKSKKRSDLMARAEVCDSFENCIFVSIHQNKFPSSKYKGLQVFYSSNNSESVILAREIKDYNKRLIDSSNNREVKPSGSEIYVLDRLKVPAVLVECGFLSNATESTLLASEQYRSKLAFMLYCSIVNYIDCKNSIKSEEFK